MAQESLTYVEREILGQAQFLAPEHRDALEELALSRPEYRIPLLDQVGMSDRFFTAVASSLATGKGSQELLAALVNAASSPARREMLWSSLGVRALRTLVQRWPLTSQEQALLLELGNCTADVLSAAWVAGQFTDPDIREQVSVKLADVARLQWLLTDGNDLSDADVAADVITSVACEGNYVERNELLTVLLWSRPALLETYATAHSLPFRQVAAGSPMLAQRQDLARALSGLDPVDGSSSAPLQDSTWVAQHRYLLLALVNNPAVAPELVGQVGDVLAASKSTDDLVSELGRSISGRLKRRPVHLSESLETCSDPAVLQVCIGRSLPGDYRPEGRTFDLYALSANPHVFEAVPSWSVHKMLETLVSFHTLRTLDWPRLDYQNRVSQALTRATEAQVLTSHQTCELQDMLARTLNQTAPVKRWAGPQELVELEAHRERRRSGITGWFGVEWKSNEPLESLGSVLWSTASRNGAIASATVFFEQVLPADPATWQMLISLTEQWQGTVAELADTAMALA
jgi:hypothetical protein